MSGFKLEFLNGKIVYCNHPVDALEMYNKGLSGATLKGKMPNWRSSWDKPIDEMSLNIAALTERK